MIIIHVISWVIVLWLYFVFLWWVWDKIRWWIQVGRYEQKRIFVTVLEAGLQLFIIFSLYTPLF